MKRDEFINCEQHRDFPVTKGQIYIVILFHFIYCISIQLVLCNNNPIIYF